MLLREHGVTRVSVGAQSFRPDLLEVLERVAETGRRPTRGSYSSRCRVRQHLARPHLRHSGPERRRSRGGPRGRPRARARAPLLLRARGEDGDAVHARARRGARPPGGGDGGLRRARRGDADRRGLPLVRDGELLPKRPRPRAPRAAQPGDLARCGLPRRRGRGGVDARRRAAAEPAIGRALHGGARGRRGSSARRRAARRGDTGRRAADARAAARRAARAWRQAASRTSSIGTRSRGSSSEGSSSGGTAVCVSRGGDGCSEVQSRPSFSPDIRLARGRDPSGRGHVARPARDASATLGSWFVHSGEGIRRAGAARCS